MSMSGVMSVSWSWTMAPYCMRGGGDQTLHLYLRLPYFGQTWTVTRDKGARSDPRTIPGAAGRSTFDPYPTAEAAALALRTLRDNRLED